MRQVGNFRNCGRLPLLVAALFFSACGWGTPGTPSPDSASGGVASSTTGDTVRVLAYNIHHGEGMDSVVDLERIADLIREIAPDLVTLQEVDSVVDRTVRVDQASELGRLTGMQPIFGSFMPYQGGAYGMALLSSWPVVESDNIRLPDGDEPRSALTAVVSSPASGRAIRLVGIHFYRTEEERLAQAAALMDRPAGDTLPTVLAGDFNSEPATAVMARLAQEWRVVPKNGVRLTYASFDPVREIDFVLLRGGSRLEVVRHWVLDEPVISDHQPIVIDLVLRE